MKFTKRMINNWRKYERVRQSGKWNMLYPQARRASRLSLGDYLFCIDKYAELKEAASKQKP